MSDDDTRGGGHKRDAEIDDGNELGTGESGNKRAKISQAHIQDSSIGDSVQVKVLIPVAAVGALIGKGGEALKQLKNTSGCIIKMSSTKDIYPGTNERIGLVRGGVNQVMNVLRAINDTIAEKLSPGQFNMDQFDQNNSDRSKTIKLVVPPTSAAVVIGKSGVMIKEIREKTGANIQVYPKAGSPEAERTKERVVSLIGKDQKEVEDACRMCLEKISTDPHHAKDSDISTGGSGGGMGGAHGGGNVQSLGIAFDASYDSGGGGAFGGGPPHYDSGPFGGGAGGGGPRGDSWGGPPPQGAGPMSGGGGGGGFDGGFRMSGGYGGGGGNAPPSLFSSIGGGGSSGPPNQDRNSGGGGMQPYIKFNPMEGIENQEVLNFLDSLQSTLRSSGFTESAVGEIMAAMQTLAKYNIMGLGLGLGVAAMASLRSGSGGVSNNQTPIKNDLPPMGGGGYNNGPSAVSGGGVGGYGPGPVSDYGNPNYPKPVVESVYQQQPVVAPSQSQDNFAATVIKARPQTDPRMLELEIPNTIVGAVLGPKAATLQEIKRYSGANCVVEKQIAGQQGSTRVVTLSGNPDNVRAGRIMVERAINEEQQRRLSGGPMAMPTQHQQGSLFGNDVSMGYGGGGGGMGGYY